MVPSDTSEGSVGKRRGCAEDGEGCHRPLLTPPGGCQPFPVWPLHITAGVFVRGLLQAGGVRDIPVYQALKTVGNALGTLPANVASGTLMSVGFRWSLMGGHTPHTPLFGFKVPNDLIRCHRPLSGGSEDFVEIVLSHPAKRSRLFLAVSLST